MQIHNYTGVRPGENFPLGHFEFHRSPGHYSLARALLWEVVPEDDAWKGFCSGHE